jgi:hypothetical protein
MVATRSLLSGTSTHDRQKQSLLSSKSHASEWLNVVLYHVYLHIGIGASQRMWEKGNLVENMKTTTRTPLQEFFGFFFFFFKPRTY